MKRTLRLLGVVTIAFVMSLLMGLTAFLLIQFFGVLVPCRNECVEYPLIPGLVGAMVGFAIVIVGTPVLWVRWAGRRPFDNQ